MLTKIEWVDHSVNPVRVKGGKVWPHGYHCTKVSAGCAHCYAESMNIRFGTGLPFDDRKVEFYLDLSVFDKLPPKPCRVFVQSMGDPFHKDVPADFGFRLLDKILEYAGLHTFFMLTKRPERIQPFLNLIEDWNSSEDYCKDIWFGTSIEDQKTADERIPHILNAAVRRRFLSVEPMLGGTDIIEYLEESGYESGGAQGWITTSMGIDWVVIGAESGPNRRPCEIELVRDLAGQCLMTKTPLFIKQLHIDGKLSKDPAEWPEDLRIQEYPHD